MKDSVSLNLLIILPGLIRITGEIIAFANIIFQTGYYFYSVLTCEKRSDYNSKSGA